MVEIELMNISVDVVIHKVNYVMKYTTAHMDTMPSKL